MSGVKNSPSLSQKTPIAHPEELEIITAHLDPSTRKLAQDDRDSKVRRIVSSDNIYPRSLNSIN